MLCFSMRPGEYFTVGGDAVIQLERVSGDRIHLIINAPREVSVLRGSVLERQGLPRPDCVLEISAQPTRQLPWNSAKRRALAELRTLLAERGPEAAELREKLNKLFPPDWESGRGPRESAQSSEKVSTG